MRLSFALFLLPAAVFLLGACQSPPKDFSSGAMIQGGVAAPVEDDEEGRLNPHYTDARELKLKVRELAEQLVANMQDCSLQGLVALPTSFVNLDNFNQTSAFGRLMAEQLFFELNQRGYPVREYRLPGSIRVLPKSGEFALSRDLGALAAKSGVVIVGTYSNARDAVFVNARLLHPGDGRVLRTANLVLEQNPTLKQLLRPSSVGGTSTATGGRASSGGKTADGTMRIRDFKGAVRPERAVAATPFDLGEDIHN